MNRRLLPLLLITLPARVCLANDAAWACQQSGDDWTCVADKTETVVATPPPAPIPAVEPEPPVALETPPAPVVEPTPPTVDLAAPPPQVVQTPALPPPVSKVKADDKPSPRIIDETTEPANSSFSLLNPAFAAQQERIFNELVQRLPRDPWQNCTAPVGTQRELLPDNALKRDNSPVDVRSNYSEIFDNEVGNYEGDVELRRADQHAQANVASYDSVSETLDLHGGVYYSENELAFYGDNAMLKLGSDQAKLRNTLFIAPSMPMRGQAEVIYRDDKSLSRYKNVAYTSCQPGNQDWVIHASDLKLNRSSGTGSAKNAWLEFKGVPIFYSPYLAFPTDNRRTSGFLAPTYNYTQNAGFIFTAPYYWNIAPNYDATFNPRYLSQRGALLAGSFRYLIAQSTGTASVEYMPNDDVLNQARYLLSFKNKMQFTPRLSGTMDLNYVSDKNYFTEMGNALSFSNFSFLKSTADLNYLRDGVAFTSRIESYQSVDPTLTGGLTPYRRLPQINLNLDHTFNQVVPLTTALDSEYVSFQHDQLVNGQRFNLKPSLSLPLQWAGAYLTPKASMQYTQYILTHQETPYTANVSRALPILSVDGGMTFERDVNLFGKNLSHTIEPRLFYLYIPKKDQRNIPVFDSSLYDFWYSNLFRENRFSGTDRVQDANQITTALTSRLLDAKTGKERLRFDIGEIFYFRNRDVTIPLPYFDKDKNQFSLRESSPETDAYSNLITELSGNLTDHVSIETGVQWNPTSHDVERGKAILHFHGAPDELFNIGYLYRKNPLISDRSNDIIQTDMSFRWPIYDNWYAVGRWQYSLLYNTTQESFVGLEKENCCWRFRIIGRQYINAINNGTLYINPQQIAEGTSQTGIFFQVEFKGLTGIGEKLDDFFAKSIYGYRKPDS